MFVDPGFYIANYMQAWLAMSHLVKHLEKEVGTNWCFNTKTGPTLKDLWQHGAAWDAQDISTQLGFNHLDSNGLNRILSAIKRTTINLYLPLESNFML